MRQSHDRILCSNAGSLPLLGPLGSAANERDLDAEEFAAALPESVRKIVERQIELGLDIVNDGEYSKRQGFQLYAIERLTGIEARPLGEGQRLPHAGITARDVPQFPDYFTRQSREPQRNRASGRPGADPLFCTGPIAYRDLDAVATDVSSLLAAVKDRDVEPYLPVVAPGNIEHWLFNLHYPDQESFLFALADALHEEYVAIASAGIVLQVDNPDLADGWGMFPEMGIEEYRRYAAVRVEALNHALAGIPADQVRMHLCWGSVRGPHANDLPLSEIVDLMLDVRADCYSIEAANPRHEHEWRVWQDVALPEEKMLMPGVVSHVTDHVEHPDLVAWRLSLYADAIGAQRVIAGTDCGMVRTTTPDLCWAKLASLTEGARRASTRLFQ